MLRAAFWLVFCACVVLQLYLLTIRVQLAFFCVTALVNASAFAMWQRRSEEEQQNGWSLYGWFTGMSFCGSVAGAIAYGCRMRQLDLYYLYSNLETIVSPTSVQLQHMAATRALSRRWTAAHFALFPFELAFVVLAKLLVLHRMQRFAVGSASHPQRWRQARRGLLAAVVLLNALGICGNFGAAFYYNQAADYSMDAANLFGANNTAAGKAARGVANEKHQLAGEVASIQRFAEVSVLILIITAFLTVGVFSTQVIASALRTLFVAGQALVSVAGAAGEQGRLVVAAANLQGRALQRKVIVTFVFVFLTLLVRSVFTILYAVAQALQNSGNPCAISFCDPCHNVYSNIHGWIIYTPWFQQVTILISSPISLLVSLWGMSSARPLEQRSSKTVQAQVEMNAHKVKRSTANFEPAMPERVGAGSH